MPAGLRPFTKVRTDDRVLTDVQQNVADTFAQFEPLRLGMIAFSPVVKAGDYSIGNETFVVYTGPGGHKFMLPKADALTGKSRLVFVLNVGKGALTVAASGADRIGTTATKSIAAASGATLAADGASTWTLTGGGDPLTVSAEKIDGGSLLPDRRLLDVGAGGTRLFAVRTGGGGSAVSLIEIANCLMSITGSGERVLLSDGGYVVFGTSSPTKFGNIGGAGTGLQIGGASGEKVGKWGVTPVVQPVLATGAGHTVDDVIAMLQSNGDCRQS